MWEMSGTDSMKQKASRPDWVVVLITGPVTILFGIVSFKCICDGRWLIPLIIIGIWLYCFIYAPRSYEIRGDFLIVNFRIGSKRFGPIVSCETIKGRDIGWLWRVFGNGGLFGFTGWYWNLRYGLFVSYVTHRKKLVLFKTEAGKKILTSPADPQGFVDGVNDTLGTGSGPPDSDAVNYDVIDRLVE
jgi:hypothetical protein